MLRQVEIPLKPFAALKQSQDHPEWGDHHQVEIPLKPFAALKPPGTTRGTANRQKSR